MKYTKKFISLILSAVMLCSVFYPAFSVMAKQDSYIKIADFSPLGAVHMPELYDVLDTDKSSKVYTYSGKSYYTEGKELYKIIRSKTESRTKKFTIRIAYNAMQFSYSLRSKLLDYLMTATSDEMSVSSTDGDYIYWHLASASFSPEFIDEKKGKYYYDITLSIEYRDTAEQEKEVDKVVSSFVNSLKTSGKSDYEIIKAVHDFICDKAEYDYVALKKMNSSNAKKFYYAFTSYGALIEGKTVCQGYALAFYRLCKELGYNCRFVSSDPDEGCHAWNIVELNGKYYFVDCTWDDEAGDYELFLVDYDGIRKQDSKYSRQHTLDQDVYDNAYFVKNFRKKFAVGDYDKTDAALLTNCTVSLSGTSYTYNGKAKTPAVKVTNPDGTTVSSENYTVYYSNNTKAGEGRLKVTGKGDFAKSSAQRRFTIKPAKVKGLTADSGKRTSNSLKLKWNKTSSGSSGYALYRKNGKSWKCIANIHSASTTSYTDKDLSSCKTYDYRIKEYKLVNKRKIYSADWSTKTTTTLPKTPSLTLSASSKAFTAKWKTVKCSGYTIQYSTNKKMSKAKTVKASSKATSKKISKLKKGKKYYVRVRANYVKTYVNGKTYTYSSKWSKIKSITVK